MLTMEAAGGAVDAQGQRHVDTKQAASDQEWLVKCTENAGSDSNRVIAGLKQTDRVMKTAPRPGSRGRCTHDFE